MRRSTDTWVSGDLYNKLKRYRVHAITVIVKKLNKAVDLTL